MNEVKRIFALVVVFAAVAAYAVPEIVPGSVTIKQNAARDVIVTYTLALGPAIVTMDVQTNAGDNVWVSIGAENFKPISGAVNRLVTESGVAQTILWKPRETWPDHVIHGGNIRAELTAWPVTAPPDYMLVDLVSPHGVTWYVDEAALPYGPATNDVYKTAMLLMRRIHAANILWRKGSPAWEKGRENYAISETSHFVQLTQDYYLGVYALTHTQYAYIMGTTAPPVDKRPRAELSVDLLRGSDEGRGWPASDAIDENSVLDRLRDLVGNGIAFDLPTDAQWEFACRAGTDTALYNGCNLTNITSDANSAKIAWTAANSGGVLHPVGELAPNDFGLYDMLGNCYEWCLDYFVTAEPSDMEVDPKGVESAAAELDNGSPKHQLRGGAYNHNPMCARNAFRHFGNGQDKPGPTRGCRLCWTLP